MTDTTVTPQTLLHTVLYLIVDYFSRSIDVHACALHVVNKMSTPVTNTCAKASLKYFQNVSDSFPVIQQVYLCQFPLVFLCVSGILDTSFLVVSLSDDIQPSSTIPFSPFHLTWQATHIRPLLSCIEKINDINLLGCTQM